MKPGNKSRTSEWAQIVGLQNRIVHEYFGVDAEIVWEIITHDLAKLKIGLESILRMRTLE